MTHESKQKTILFLALALILIMLIAASLAKLDLQPGMPLPSTENGQVVLNLQENAPVGVLLISDFFKTLLVMLLGALLLYSIYKFIKGTPWKELCSILFYTLFLTLFSAAILFLIVMLLPRSEAPIIETLPPVPIIEPVTAPLGAVPPLLIWLVGIGLLFTTLWLTYWVIVGNQQSASTLTLLGLEAEKARQALLTGLDLKNVIISCYQQMSRVLQEQQGIKRADSMTTGEFERLLESMGAPYEAVHQLTTLFEAVRYGQLHPDQVDQQNAIKCLEDIVLYSHQARQTG